jgi:hypothetical protein
MNIRASAEPRSRSGLERHGVKVSVKALGGLFPLLVAAFGVLVAFLMPSEAASVPPLLAAFSDGMSLFIPSIEKFSAVSRIPVVTETFLAILWALVPLMAYLNLRLRVVTMQRGEVSSNFFAFLFGIVFFCTIAMVPIVWIDMRPPSGSPAGSGAVALKLVGSSRFWLGTIGALVCWVCSVAMSILFRLVSNNGRYARQLLSRKHRSRDEN